MKKMELNEKKMEHTCILLVVMQTLLRLFVVIVTAIFAVHCWYDAKTYIKIIDAVIFVMLCIGCVFLSFIFNKFTDNYIDKWGQI